MPPKKSRKTKPPDKPITEIVETDHGTVTPSNDVEANYREMELESDDSFSLSPCLAPLNKNEAAEETIQPKDVENVLDLSINETNKGRKLPLPNGAHTPSKDYRLLYHEVKHKFYQQAENLKMVTKENDELRSSIKEKDKSLSSITNDKEKLEELFESKKTEIDSLSRTNGYLQDEIRKLTTKIEDLETEKEDCTKCNNIKVIEKENTKLKDELKTKGKEIERVNNEVTKHQKNGKVLKEKVKTLENELEGKDMTIKAQLGSITQLRDKTKSTKEGKTNEPQDKSENDANIDSRLEAFSNDILSKVVELMDSKIKVLKNSTPSTTSTENRTANVRSQSKYSDVVSQAQEMKAVMREARNEEKIEEKEKQKRACNIIIHGADEVGQTADEIIAEDNGYIKEIFAKIGVNVTPNIITRLGDKTGHKNRPIKLVMKSKNDKEVVMGNLNRLKGTERYFGKISIKDDHTKNEREQIRSLTEQAKQENAKNTERISKVRGDSKNGWRVVTFPRN